MAEDFFGRAFIPYYEELMNLLKTNKELEKTARGIFKQAAWAVAGTIVGGAVGGRVGAMIGIFVGGVLGYNLSNDYQALIDVLQNLSDKDKQEIVSRVQKLVGNHSKKALIKYIGSEKHRAALINLLTNYTVAKKGK